MFTPAPALADKLADLVVGDTVRFFSDRRERLDRIEGTDSAGDPCMRAVFHNADPGPVSAVTVTLRGPIVQWEPGPGDVLAVTLAFSWTGESLRSVRIEARGGMVARARLNSTGSTTPGGVWLVEAATAGRHLHAPTPAGPCPGVVSGKPLESVNHCGHASPSALPPGLLAAVERYTSTGATLPVIHPARGVRMCLYAALNAAQVRPGLPQLRGRFRHLRRPAVVKGGVRWQSGCGRVTGGAGAREATAQGHCL